MTPLVVLILGVLALGATVHLVTTLATIKAGRDVKLARIGAEGAIPLDEVELAIHRTAVLAGDTLDAEHLERVEALVLEDLHTGAIGRELDGQSEDLAGE